MRSARGNYHRLLPARIGVNARGKSRRLQRALADFGVEESFAKAAARVHEHYGITLGATAVREATLLHARRARIRLESEYEKPFRALPVHGAARVVAQADGSMVCTVPAGRRKSPRPRQWKEIRLVAAQAQGTANPCYAATLLGGVADAGHRWGHCARDAGWGLRSQIHGLGDGAPWVASQCREVFGDQGRFLVDYYHACEYLAAAAPRCRPHRPEAWRRTQGRRLKAGRLDKVLAELRTHCEPLTVAEPEAFARTALRYLETRAECLDYPGAIAQDLPIGSGLIESGHRHVLQARLKKPGAAWLESSVEDIAQLRVLRSNNRWNAFWN